MVYATWSGLGIVLVTAAAAILYKQAPDVWAVVGMALIVAGVLVLNLLSKSATHGEPPRTPTQELPPGVTVR